MIPGLKERNWFMMNSMTLSVTTGDWRRGREGGWSIPHSVQELARVKVNAGERQIDRQIETDRD